MSSKPIFLVIVLAYAEFWLTTTSGAEDIDPISLDPIPEPDPDLLHVYALPVGQGDCTIIKCPAKLDENNNLKGGEIIMVDCGSSSAAGNKWNYETVRNFLSHLGIIPTRVYIFISHADVDHFNYFYNIFDTPNRIGYIKHVWIGGTLNEYKLKNDETMYQWLNIMKDHNALQEIKGGNPCTSKECPTLPPLCSVSQNIQFDILAANHRDCSPKNCKEEDCYSENCKEKGCNKCDETNPKSIVMKVSVHTQALKSILLPGDMEGGAANNIAIKLKQDLQSTVYKMAHHGASCKANPYTWLEYIKPDIAFASSAYPGKGYNHPRCDTVGRLELLRSLDSLPWPTNLFSCGTNNRNENYLRVKDFEKEGGYPYNILGTSPTSKMHCVLHYQFTVKMDQPGSVITAYPPYCFDAESPNTVSKVLEEQHEYEYCDADGDIDCNTNDDL